jgi:hypothetical protein
VIHRTVILRTMRQQDTPMHLNAPRTIVRTCGAVLLTLVFIALGAPAAAQDGFTNARTMGMAGAASGAGANGAIYVNPAGLMALSMYSAEIGYHRNNPGKRNAFGISLVDSQTNPNIAAGVGYNYTFGPGPGGGRDDDARDHDLRFALAVPVVPNAVFLGVGGHYTSVRGVTTVTTAPAVGLPGNSTVTEVPGRNNVFTVDAGIMATLQRIVALGFAVQNIAQPDDILQGRRFIGGIGVYLGPAHIELQYSTEQQLETDKFLGTFAGAAELTIARIIPLRFGVASRGITPGTWISAGAGYRSTTAGVDLAFQQSTQLAADRAFMASFLFYQ